MVDTTVFVPIVNGASATVQGLYNQTTITGTVAIMPFLELWANGGTVGTGNQLQVFDAQALVNTGSIVALETTIGTNTGSIVTNTGSLVSILSTGTINVAAASTPIALDVSTVTTGGTAVNALSAGHANKGGILFNPNSFTIFYAQIGAAGTVATGNTYPLAANTTANLFPSTAAVSVNSSTSATVFCGNGLT